MQHMEACDALDSLVSSMRGERADLEEEIAALCLRRSTLDAEAAAAGSAGCPGTALQVARRLDTRIAQLDDSHGVQLMCQALQSAHSVFLSSLHQLETAATQRLRWQSQRLQGSTSRIATFPEATMQQYRCDLHAADRLALSPSAAAVAASRATLARAVAGVAEERRHLRTEQQETLRSLLRLKGMVEQRRA